MSVIALSFFRLQKLFPQIPLLQLGELLGLPEYHYYSKAVIQEEQKDGYIKTGKLIAEPGTRFPHFWLDQEHKVSTLDLLGKEFILFAAEDHVEWKKAATTAGIPFYSLQSSGSTKVLKNDEVALVRPDGFVAWRNDKLPANTTTALKEVLGSLLQYPEQVLKNSKFGIHL